MCVCFVCVVRRPRQLSCSWSRLTANVWLDGCALFQKPWLCPHDHALFVQDNVPVRFSFFSHYAVYIFSSLSSGQVAFYLEINFFNFKNIYHIVSIPSRCKSSVCIKSNLNSGNAHIWLRKSAALLNLSIKYPSTARGWLA